MVEEFQIKIEDDEEREVGKDVDLHEILVKKTQRFVNLMIKVEKVLRMHWRELEETLISAIPQVLEKFGFVKEVEQAFISSIYKHLAYFLETFSPYVYFVPYEKHIVAKLMVDETEQYTYVHPYVTSVLILEAIEKGGLTVRESLELLSKYRYTLFVFPRGIWFISQKVFNSTTLSALILMITLTADLEATMYFGTEDALSEKWYPIELIDLYTPWVGLVYNTIVSFLPHEELVPNYDDVQNRLIDEVVAHEKDVVNNYVTDEEVYEEFKRCFSECGWECVERKFIGVREGFTVRSIYERLT